MQNFNPRNEFSVTFHNQRPVDNSPSLLDAVNRFGDADLIWMSVLETAASALSIKGRYAFGLTLGCLVPGPAPSVSPIVLVPDDWNGITAEAQFMSLPQLTCIGTQLPAILGSGHPDIIKVEGLITAVHRMLRTAKAHS